LLIQEQVAPLPLERLTDVVQHFDSPDDTAARAGQKELLSEYSLALRDLLGQLLSARREKHERRLFMPGVRLRPEQPFVDQRVDERLQALSTCARARAGAQPSAGPSAPALANSVRRGPDSSPRRYIVAAIGVNRRYNVTASSNSSPSSGRPDPRWAAIFAAVARLVFRMARLFCITVSC
jgi:hypothetical protein